MAYSSGILKHRVTVLNKVLPTQGQFGTTTTYEEAGTFWADITWSKGTKALREGALDAYDTILVRMRYNTTVTRDSRLKHSNTLYQIHSLHADYQDNTVQITATEIVAP